MKRIFLLVIILFSIITNAIATELYSDSYSNENEINLDLNIPSKKYKLEKPTYNNSSTLQNNYEDNDIPLDFMPTPLRLLKQYQQDQL